MERSQKGSKVKALFSSAQNLLFSNGKNKAQEENDNLFKNANERQRQYNLGQKHDNFRSYQQSFSQMQPDPMSMIHLRGPRPFNNKKRTLQELDQYEPSRRLPSPVYKSDFHYFDQKREEAIDKDYFRVIDQRKDLDPYYGIGQQQQHQLSTFMTTVGSRGGGLYKSESDGGSTMDNQTQATKGDEDQMLLMDLYKTSLENQRNLTTQQRQTINAEEEDDEMMEDLKVKIITEVQEREKEKKELEAGIESLQFQIEDQQRLKELINNQQPSQSVTFELQPHLIYKNSNQFPMPQLNLEEDLKIKGGLFTNTDIAYMFQANTVNFWNIKLFQQSLVKLTLKSEITAIQQVYDPLSNRYFILITTQNEMQTYEIKIQAYSGKFTLEQQHKDQQLAVNNVTTIYQNKGSGRIFIGGERYQITELSLSGLSERNNGSKHNACTNLLSSLFSSQPSKLKKISKTQIKSVINKVISPFYKSAPFDPSNIAVKQFCEQERSNTLFVLVIDSKNKSQSYIEVYDLGVSGNDFKLQFKITMTKVYQQIEEQLEIKIDQSFKNEVEIFDICVVRDSLWVTMNNGLLIEIGLTFEKAKDQELDKINDNMQSISQMYQSNIKIAHSTTIKNIITLPLYKLTEKYEMLFDDYIVSDSNQQQHWKPLITDNIQLTQRNNFLTNQGVRIIDHKQIKDQHYFLLSTTTKVFSEEEKKDFDLVNHYVISMTSNFRVPATLRKNNQQLVGVCRLQCSHAIELQLQVIKDNVTQLRVLTTDGVQTLVVATQRDIICQYLKLILTYDQQSQQQVQVQPTYKSFIEYVQQDFEKYLQSQDLNITLQALLSIILANPHSDTFVNNNLNDYYYVNKAKLFASDMQFIPGQVNPQQIERINLQKLVQSLENYVNQETYTLNDQITLEMQSLAVEIYLTVTDSTKDHQYLYHHSARHDRSNVTIDVNERTRRMGLFQQEQTVRLSDSSQIIQTEKENDGILEFRRLQSIYLFIINTVKKVRNENVFRLAGSLNNPTIDSNITPDQLQKIIVKMERLQEFIKVHREQLLTIEELDHSPGTILPPLTTTQTQDQSYYSLLKQDLQHCQRLLARLTDGLQTLRNLLKWSHLPQTLKILFDTKESAELVKIQLLDFVTQGIAIPQVGALIEQFVAQTIDIQSLMNSNLLNQEISKMSSHFLSETTLNLIIGKKFLNEAQLIMNKIKSKQRGSTQFTKEERFQLQQLGFMLFMKSARYVNLSAALTELIKNQMYLQVIALCVKRIDEIDILQEYLNKQQSISQSLNEISGGQDTSNLPLIATSSNKDQTFTAESVHNLIHSLEYDKKDALIVVCEMIEEVVNRIKQLENAQKKGDGELLIKKMDNNNNNEVEKKGKEVVEKSRFEGINLLQQQLKREQKSENLKALKKAMFEACLKCKSALFHQELYHFLLKIQQLSDLMVFKTPYATAFLSQINESFDLTSKEYQQLSMKQQSDILQQKLEATYLHLKKTHQYAEAFITIMDQICNAQSVLDINERVSWMQKAEGCYLQDQEQHQAYLASQQSKQSQTKPSKPSHLHQAHDTITNRQLKVFHSYKDYFLIVMQLRDTLKTKFINRTRKIDNEQDQQVFKQVIEELTYKVPETNELYQFALQMKQWTEYLKIVKVTEVQQQGLISEEDTQSRIDYMYEHLLDSKYIIDKLALNRKFQKFLSTLDSLQQVSGQHSISETNQINQNIELFPSSLIIKHVESINVEWMKQNQEFGFLNIIIGDVEKESNGQWHPFWHVDYFFEKHFQPLFNELLRMTRLQPRQPTFNQLLSLKKSDTTDLPSDQPEDYLSFAYLIIKWHRSISGGMVTSGQHAQVPVISRERFRSYQPEMIRLRQQLVQATSNELLYSKEYYQGLVKITQKIDELINL